MRSSQLPRGRVAESDLKTIVGRNIGCIFDLNNKNVNTFRPGVVARFTPGVHEVPCDIFSLRPNTTNFFPEEQFTVKGGKKRATHNTYGQNNLCTAHLFGTYLRVMSSGYDLNASRARMRDCDKSNFQIAEVVKSSFNSVVPPVKDSTKDETIVVNLTPESSQCVERKGLIIYGAPGNGKTYAQNGYLCRCVDTDFMYDPSTQVVKTFAEYAFTIFTNDYEIAVGHAPTVMFIPTNDILTDRVRDQLGAKIDTVVEWISDLNVFVRDLERKSESIADADGCVVIVRVSDDTQYISDICTELCRQN